MKGPSSSSTGPSLTQSPANLPSSSFPPWSLRVTSTVGGLVGVAERGAAVEQVLPAIPVPQTGGAQAVQWAMSSAAPSTIAASTTRPKPERSRS